MVLVTIGTYGVLFSKLKFHCIRAFSTDEFDMKGSICKTDGNWSNFETSSLKFPFNSTIIKLFLNRLQSETFIHPGRQGICMGCA